jgi:hypothetical protein
MQLSIAVYAVKHNQISATNGHEAHLQKFSRSPPRNSEHGEGSPIGMALLLLVRVRSIRGKISYVFVSSVPLCLSEKKIHLWQAYAILFYIGP